MDGNIADWGTALTNPDNVTSDGTPDADGPIADVGRDFTHMAYTMDATNMYLYFGRAGSATNQVTVLLFMDVNNDGGMSSGEPVIEVTWTGSNRRGSVRIWDYVPASASGDALTADGFEMPGDVGAAERNTVFTNDVIGTADGLGVEVYVPLSLLNRLGSSDPAYQLAFGENFNFHVSSLNGSVFTFGAPNSTNDNWRRCDAVFTPLPIRVQEVVKMAKKEVDAALVLLNNPIKDNISFQYQAPADGAVHIRIYNSTGQLVYQERKMASKGRNFISIPPSVTAAKTVYVVAVTHLHQVTHTARAIKL